MARRFLLLLVGALLFCFPVRGKAAEIATKYATIVYQDEEILRRFNDEILWGGGFFFRRPRQLTLADEVKNKVDSILEKVEAVLEMFPKGLRFTMVLLPDDDDVQEVFQQKYGNKVDYIAFYVPPEKTMYVAASKVRLRVLAHELAHVVVDHYFEVPPPVKIHELLAQFAETHVTD